MSSTSERPEIDQFLVRVCENVRANKLHNDIKDELQCHIDELVSDYLEEGKSETEAVKLAITSMGDPMQIGREFDKAHRPHTNWGLLLSLLLLTGAGIVTMLSIQVAGPYGNMSNVFEMKLVFTAIGIALMMLLWVIDYQKVKKYSEHAYLSGIALLLLGPLFGSQINGSISWVQMGLFNLHMPTVSTIALAIGLAGAAPARNWNLITTIIQLVYRGLLPIVLLGQMNDMIWMAIYAAVFMNHIYMTRKSQLQVAAIGISAIAFLGWIVSRFRDDYDRARFLSFINRNDDPLGSDYMLNHSLEAMHATNWWGHGFGAKTVLQYSSGEGVLPYFIYSFGWVAGLSLIVLIFSFVYKLVSSIHIIKDDFGKRIAASLGTVLAIQCVWSVLMVFGYAPYVSLSIPFLSYGGTAQILSCAMVGLLLGIYRRRNMVVTRNAL